MKNVLLGLCMVMGLGCGGQEPNGIEARLAGLKTGATTRGYECGAEEGICTCGNEADCKAMEAVCATEIECPFTLTVCWCIQAKTPDPGTKPPSAPAPLPPGGGVLN